MIYLGVISLDPNYSSVALEMAEVWIIFLVPFCRQGGIDAIFKYPVMSDGSIRWFGHIEHQNPSINDAMG